MADDDEVWNQIDDEEDTEEEEGGSHGLTEEELDYLPPDDDDEDDEGPDDDDPTPPEVIAALGFDPDHADWLTSDAEPEIDPYDRWLAQYYRGEEAEPPSDDEAMPAVTHSRKGSSGHLHGAAGGEHPGQCVSREDSAESGHVGGQEEDSREAPRQKRGKVATPDPAGAIKKAIRSRVPANALAYRNAPNHNSHMFDRILPHWVEPDPLRSRAVDALGLQAVADRLADRLLPGLSVATSRARYLSFLCWVRHKIGPDVNERAIHQWEVALAVTEYGLHGLSDAQDSSDFSEDGAPFCRFVGIRNIKRRFEHLQDRDLRREDPELVYKTPAWRNYRPALVNLGLLEDDRRYGLTEEGRRVASAFDKAVHYRCPGIRRLPESACLSNISQSERRILRDRLGFGIKGRLPEDVGGDRFKRDRLCRARFFREMQQQQFLDDLDPARVLRAYEKKPTDEEPAATLHAAAIWEYLSLGLNVIFCSWVRAVAQRNQDAFFRAFARSGRPQVGSPTLAAVSLDDPEVALRRARACLRGAKRLFECRGSGNLLSDNEHTFALASHMLQVAKPDAARKAIQRLLLVHQQAKGDQAWVLCPDSELRRAVLNRDTKKTWRPPHTVRLHPYRMSAFEQLVRDLRVY